MRCFLPGNFLATPWRLPALMVLRPFLTVEVEVAVQLLYRYVYIKLLVFAVLTGLFFGVEKKALHVF